MNEEIKRELQRILIYECRCDERLRDKAEGSTRLAYTEKGESRELFRRAGTCLEEHFFFLFLKR
jgi:hypothetical protein